MMHLKFLPFWRKTCKHTSNSSNNDSVQASSLLATALKPLGWLDNSHLSRDVIHDKKATWYGALVCVEDCHSVTYDMDNVTGRKRCRE
ncbi:hypothetical protein ElyMa_006582200 [Elysia marginata]|uniref:Uncharacterized protein n=1 Tax=Elysia marginata TaxID=1093978 RepID=A0AAV4II78_9GAST|nr:hypothetical protein ElyMa_006582200 [Elysia marginata]